MSTVESPESVRNPKSKRLVSLDAFRGLTIIGMLLVNNVALDTATPSHLKHADWNEGLTFADMVFPWFLFIVGVAVPYAYASFRRKGNAGRQYAFKALSRMVILVFLGCLIDSSLAKTPVFGLGVLQLIGLAYLAGALLYELPIVWRLSIAAAFLIGHWLLIMFVSIPGMEKGAFTESRNVVTYINQIYLAQYHLNGLLSLIPTAAMVLIGTGIGDILRGDRIDGRMKVGYLAGIGVALALVGWLWSLSLPFNKPMWTASYILFSAGLASVLLAVFYYIIDVIGWEAWSFPLVVFGMNAIVAYVAPILVKIHVLQEWSITMADGSHVQIQQAILQWFAQMQGSVIGGWVYTASYILFWWLVTLMLYNKKIFVKV